MILENNNNLPDIVTILCVQLQPHYFKQIKNMKRTFIVKLEQIHIMQCFVLRFMILLLSLYISIAQ